MSTETKPKKTKTPKVVNNPPVEDAGQEATPASPGKSLGEQAKERAARKKTIAQKDVFRFVKKSEKPLAPQAQVIVNTIEAAGDGGIVRPELIEALGPVLTTRQPVERILVYYSATLVDMGLIEVINPERSEAASTPAE